MDQELKQRLIGAAVITALAAIFVPMLFDDPIDESGKSINELKIPELPSKAQDVEIMPLPEKVEDVAATAPESRPAEPAIVDEGAAEAALEAPQPAVKITEKETVATSPKWVEPDEDVAEAEAAAIARPVIAEKPKTNKAAVKPEPVVKETPVKIPKPIPTAAPVQTAVAPVQPQPVVEQNSKPAAEENAVTRWYLNAGSFSQKNNAVAQQENLKKQGFAATIKEVAGPKGTVFKVRVGPMMDKAKAQAMKAKLTQINISSFISGDE